MRRIAAFALFLFVAFVSVGFMLPTQVHVERSIDIDRPANMMFAILNNFHYFKKWSYWSIRDPKAEFLLTGPEEGVGAHMSWIGDPRLVGSGWQEIVASKPYEQIDIQLAFDNQGIANTRFKLTSQGTSTHINWTYDADVTAGQDFTSAFLARYYGLLFDRWIGGDFDRSLALLKHFAESQVASDFSQLEISQVDVKARNILYVSVGNSQDSAAISTAMASAYTKISAFMHENGFNMRGQPMAITTAWEDGTYGFNAAIPVDRLPVELSGEIQAGKSPAGAAVRAIHHGPLNEMMPTYEKLAAYLSAHSLHGGNVSWERYMTDPARTKAADLITYIYIMLDEPTSAQ